VTANSSPLLILGPVINITIAGTLVLNNSNLIIDSNDIIKISSGGKISESGFLGGSITSGLASFAVPSSGFIGPSTITGGALPIKLLSFNAITTEKSIILTWASASEKNFNYYTIERSVNGKDFLAIGKVDGSPNSLVRKDYTYEDQDPAQGISYYRLRAVDLDNTSETFSVIMMKFSGGKTKVNIFPNPTSDQKINVQFNFDLQEGVTIQIYDARGNLVKTELFVQSGSLLTLNLPDLTRGIYNVIIQSNEFTSKTSIAVE
jgi:hypothetical protein